MSDIDNVIELFAKTKPPKASKKPRPVAGNPLPLQTAQAVAEALEAADGALKVWEAKAEARKAQGITRMGEKRWQVILQAGIDAGLFVVANRVVMTPDPEGVQGVASIAVDMFGCPSGPDEQLSEIADASGEALPPELHDCGHYNFLQRGEDNAKNQEAIDAGFCCHAAQVHASKEGVRGYDLPVDWQVRGLKEPIPPAHRRSAERQDGLGWPGLCSHPTTNLYIGGVGNDCRYHNKGKERCIVHAVRD